MCTLSCLRTVPCKKRVRWLPRGFLVCTCTAYTWPCGVLHVWHLPQETTRCTHCLFLRPLQRDMLRLDALIMTVQLNIRRLLEARLHAFHLQHLIAHLHTPHSDKRVYTWDNPFVCLHTL